MNDTDGYEIALLVSKRLRRTLLKGCGALAIVAIVFILVDVAIPRSSWASMPDGSRYILVFVPILSLFGACVGFASWIGISIRAAIYDVAVDDVVEEAARRGLVDRRD